MTRVKLKFGKNCKYTCFGLKGCSHGASWGGYEYYVYGFKWLISLEIMESWGSINPKF